MARPTALRRVRWLFRFFLLALLLGVNGIIFWRFCSAGIPSEMKKIVPNQTLAEAFAANGENLSPFRQEQGTITRSDSAYGYFSVEECVFYPEANQVQLVFRYNKSTLNHLAEDKGLAEVPPREGTYYDLTVLIATDKTPDNKKDNSDPATLSYRRVSAVGEPVREETALYSWFRYTFNGVEITKDTDSVYLDIYWVGDVDYEKDAYGTLCLWDYESQNRSVSLSSGDKQILREWLSRQKEDVE